MNRCQTRANKDTHRKPSIIFLSRAYPLPKDGYQKRVQEIADLFKSWQIVFYPVQDTQKTITNFISFVRLLCSVDLIYLHSLSSSSHLFCHLALPFFKKKLVWDVHGLVPEEHDFLGRKKEATGFQKLEKRIADYCNIWITVTKSMRDYLILKHPKLAHKKTFIIPPGFDLYPLSETQKDFDFVYSGASQKWQNLDLVRKCVSINQTLNTLILTSEGEILKPYFPKSVTFGFAVKNDYFNYLSKSKMGFLLRDEHILNKAAFPTKLLDYLQAGVVPVFLSKQMADASQWDIKFISVESLLEGKLPDEVELRLIAGHNRTIAEAIFGFQMSQKMLLLKQLNDSFSG